MSSTVTLAIIHPAVVDVTKLSFRKMAQRGQPVETDKRYLRKDGSDIWINVCNTPVLNATGRPESAVVVAIDITERKKKVDALRKTNELLEELVSEYTHVFNMAHRICLA